MHLFAALRGQLLLAPVSHLKEYFEGKRTKEENPKCLKILTKMIKKTIMRNLAALDSLQSGVQDLLPPLSRGPTTTVHVRQLCPTLSTLFTLFSSKQGFHHCSCSSTLPQLVHLVHPDHLVHLVLLSAGFPPLFMFVNLAPPTSPILLLLATSQSHVSESKKNQSKKLRKQTKLE